MPHTWGFLQATGDVSPSLLFLWVEGHFCRNLSLNEKAVLMMWTQQQHKQEDTQRERTNHLPKLAESQMVTDYCILPKHSTGGASKQEKKTQYFPPFSLQSNLPANTGQPTIQGALTLPSQMSTPLRNLVFLLSFFGGGGFFFFFCVSCFVLFVFFS